MKNERNDWTRSIHISVVCRQWQSTGGSGQRPVSDPFSNVARVVTVLNIVDMAVENRILPLFRLAFRPFFLFGAIFSLVAVALWGEFWLTGGSWHPYGGWLWWHSHEMLFGFVCAIIVGFLLTAVQNWTGLPSLSSWPLAGLFTLWLLPRVLMLMPASDALDALIPWLDVLFLPVVALIMVRLVMKARQWRNLVFVPLLLLLTLTNCQMHWGLSQNDLALSRAAGQSGIYIILLIVSVLGGRVIPFFTASGTRTLKPEPLIPVEVLAIGSVATLALLQLAGLLPLLSASLVGALFLLAGVCHAWRFLRWRFWITFRVPLLWSLHAAYGFLVLGFWLCGLQFWGLFESVPFHTLLHSFTLGTMGLLILAMMARVSLGHTGRPLRVSFWISLAFALLAVAVVLRVLVPVLIPAVSHSVSYVASAGLWLFAYGLFTVIYLPILSRPRVDGRPG